jgi:hypothetical protein
MLRWLFGQGVPISPFSETVAGFLKLVELGKGLVVLLYLASLVEVYGIHDPMTDGYTTCGVHGNNNVMGRC